MVGVNLIQNIKTDTLQSLYFAFLNFEIDLSHYTGALKLLTTSWFDQLHNRQIILILTKHKISQLKESYP